MVLQYSTYHAPSIWTVPPSASGRISGNSHAQSCSPSLSEFTDPSRTPYLVAGVAIICRTVCAVCMLLESLQTSGNSIAPRVIHLAMLDQLSWRPLPSLARVAGQSCSRYQQVPRFRKEGHNRQPLASRIQSPFAAQYEGPICTVANLGV